MDSSPEALLRRIVHDNQAARLRFSGLADRTITAVVAGDWDKLGPIVREASDGGDTRDIPTEGGASSPSKMEA